MNEHKSKEEFITWLHDKHYDSLFLKATKYVSDNPDLKDAVADSVQETYYIASNEYRSLQSHPDIGGWLYITCTNLLRKENSRLRTRRKYHAFSMDDNTRQPVRDPHDSIAAYEAKEDHRLLVKRIESQLNGRQKGVFRAYFLKGHSIDDIAKRNNTTPQATKGFIYRIRSTIRKMTTHNQRGKQ